MCHFKCYNFVKKNYFTWYHIPNTDKRKDSINFLIKSGLLEKLPSNTAVYTQEEKVLSSNGMTAESLLSTWMQFPDRSKLCKARPADAGFQMFSFVAKPWQESAAPSAVPFCSNGIFPKILVEKKVPSSCCKQNWFRRDLSKNWLRVLENTLFCSVGCWLLVKECSDVELPKFHCTHTSPTTQLCLSS